MPRSLFALLAAAAAGQAAEPAYPTKPVRVIVPYPPGGTTDPTARAFTGWFADKFGTSFVIDNRPGAGSTLGHGIAAKATPDGYTLVLGTSGGLVVSAAFGSKLSYDSVKDFTPIGVGVYVPFLIVVHPSVPAKNVKDLVDLAKAQPGKINFASPGTGTPNHLGMELLTSLTGAKFTHVPYKGGGAATVDLLAGRVQAIFGGAAPWQPHMASGKVRAIAIGHPTRLPSLPDIPAIAETYPGFNNTTLVRFPRPGRHARARGQQDQCRDEARRRRPGVRQASRVHRHGADLDHAEGNGRDDPHRTRALEKSRRRRGHQARINGLSVAAAELPPRPTDAVCTRWHKG